MTPSDDIEAAQPHRFELKVYYEDTDCLGVVYYANYLKYLERGRTEFFDAQGRPVQEWNAAGYNFAVYRADVTYLAAARLGDQLTVVTRQERTTDYRLSLSQDIYRGDEQIIRGKIQLVCLDENLELRELPEEVQA